MTVRWVLEDPQAQAKTTRDTLLIALGAPASVVAECLLPAKYPVMYVGIELQTLYTPIELKVVDVTTKRPLKDYERDTDAAKLGKLQGEGWEVSTVIRWLRH